MKLRDLLPVAAFALVSFARAESVATPFIADLESAKKQAKAGHKDILVDFTGSDWCGWCRILDKEVFHTPEYLKEAPAHFVSVQLDFPQKNKPSEEIRARNAAWKAELKSMSFPDVLLLDENGKVYANTGYREGGAKVYLAHMEELRSRRIRRDEALALAAKSEGIEKAKHLDAALSALRSDEVILTHYNDLVKEAVALDSEDKAGIRTKYRALHRRRQCEYEIRSLSTGDAEARIAKLKAYAEKPDIPVESRQYALYMAGNACCDPKLRDYARAIEVYRGAIAVAPDSPLVEQSVKDAIIRAEKNVVRVKSENAMAEISTMFGVVSKLENANRTDEALAKTEEFIKRISEMEGMEMQLFNMQSRQCRMLVKTGGKDAAFAKLKAIVEAPSTDSRVLQSLGEFIQRDEVLSGDKDTVALTRACAKRIIDNPASPRSPGVENFLRKVAATADENASAR